MQHIDSSECNVSHSVAADAVGEYLPLLVTVKVLMCVYCCSCVWQLLMCVAAFNVCGSLNLCDMFSSVTALICVMMLISVTVLVCVMMLISV